MRLNVKVLEELSKGFSYNLVSIILDCNKIGDNGIEVLAEQFYKGEGDHEKEPWRTNKSPFNNNWQLKHLSLRENELKDNGVKHLKKVVKNLDKLLTIDVRDNLVVYADQLIGLQNEICRHHYEFLNPEDPFATVLWKPS